jgi:PAS domain S-box-containing protein
MNTSPLINDLKLENSQLKAIQSAMPDPYYIRDMDYNVILWPDAIAKLTGYSAEEVKGKKCHDIFKANVCPPGNQCPTQRCVQVKQFLKDVAVDVYHKNGAIVHTLVSNAGIYDEEGKPIGAVEIVKDNTVIEASMDTIGKIIKELEAEATDLTFTSIEAAHARESSNRFKIVSDGIMELSDNSGASAQQINSSIQEIIGLIKGTADSGSINITKLLGHAHEIDHEIKTLNETLTIIKNLATNTGQLVGEQDSSIAKANRVSQNLAAIAENLTKEFNKVFQAIQHTDMG